MRFRSVWFDCDSTLAAIEGIDELGRLRDQGTRQRVTSLTDAAMAGELPLDRVYEERLAMLRPTRSECDSIGERYIAAALPDAALVVAALHSLGKKVGVVSGGLLPPVLALARHLGIPDHLVAAVGVTFDDAGRYVDFDRDSPLWRNGGKIEVLGERPSGERPLGFVGDGVTDLEARDVVERFVGFGGVARRPVVERSAGFYVATPGLAGVLPHLLEPDETAELRRTPRFRTLVAE